MKRIKGFQTTKNRTLDIGLSDEESLLIQLIENLIYSHLLFDDALPSEVEQGYSIINNFYLFAPNTIPSLLPPNQLERYIQFLNQLKLLPVLIERKLVAKLRQCTDALLSGAFHNMNIRRSIHLGLYTPGTKQKQLGACLLQIAALHTMFINGLGNETQSETYEKPSKEPEEKIDTSHMFGADEAEDSAEEEKTVYSIDNILSMRQHVLERVEKFRQEQSLVNLIKNIKSQKTVKVEPLTEEGRIAEEKEKFRLECENIKFERPSEFFKIGLKQQMPAHNNVNTRTQATDTTDKADREIVEEKKALIEIQAPAPVEASHNEDQFEELEDEGQQDETDVLYGNGKITKRSLEKFILTSPDSAVKFATRMDVEGKPIHNGAILQIYDGWEKRGLRRKHVSNMIFELMEWSDYPVGMAPIEIIAELKDKIYEMNH